MPDPTQEKEVEFKIQLTSGGCSVSPGADQVKAGSIVRWTINAGMARVVFRLPSAVIVASDTVTPTALTAGIAADRGTHYYGIVAWPSEDVTPHFIMAVLIVE